MEKIVKIIKRACSAIRYIRVSLPKLTSEKLKSLKFPNGINSIVQFSLYIDVIHFSEKKKISIMHCDFTDIVSEMKDFKLSYVGLVFLFQKKLPVTLKKLGKSLEETFLPELFPELFRDRGTLRNNNYVSLKNGGFR